MKRLVQAFLGGLGYRLVRLQNVTALDSFFSLLKERGFAPKHIIDVGANHGNWTRRALKYFPDAYYTLVEPQDHLRTHVQDLLGRDGKIRWIGAEAAKAAGMRQIEVPVTTLNEIARTSDEPFPDMIKIDAEGFDLRVLAGASELVGKTDIFFLETAICCGDMTISGKVFENTLENAIRTMAHAGYCVLDVTDLNRSPKYGVLWLCEVAFLRKASHLLDGVDSYE